MTKRAPYDFNRVVKLDARENGKNLSQEKEQIARYDWIAPNPKYDANDKYLCDYRYTRPITIRVWTARSAQASTVYASIWAGSRNGLVSMSGHGKAGGYGYDKESAAISAAFESAGIYLERDFGGCGESCTRIAIKSLAKRLGWKTGQVIMS